MATPSIAVPARPKGALLRWGRMPLWLRYLVLLAALIGAWQLFVELRQDRENFDLLYATPRQVFDAFVDGWRDGTIRDATWATLKVLLGGVGIGLAIAAVFSALATLSKVLDDLLRLLTSIMNPLPGVAVLPLAMLWFGLNTKAVLFAIANATIWPIAINVTTGFRTANPTIVAVGRNIGLSSWRLVTDVLTPAALPHMISGLKTAWAFGWRTIIAAELVFGALGEKAGLGTYINESKLYFLTPQVFAGLVTIAILGVVFETLFEILERRTVVRWGMKTSENRTG